MIVFPIFPIPGDYSGPSKPRINLIPFYFGTCDHMPGLCLTNIVEYILGNVFLTIPFDFGIGFVARLNQKDFFWLAVLVGTVFEVTQLILSLVFRSAVRAVDINDVILNATGVWLGYAVFRIFGHPYLYTTPRFRMRHEFVLAYIHAVVRQSTGTDY